MDDSFRNDNVNMTLARKVPPVPETCFKIKPPIFPVVVFLKNVQNLLFPKVNGDFMLKIQKYHYGKNEGFFFETNWGHLSGERHIHLRKNFIKART